MQRGLNVAAKSIYQFQPVCSGQTGLEQYVVLEPACCERDSHPNGTVCVCVRACKFCRLSR